MNKPAVVSASFTVKEYNVSISIPYDKNGMATEVEIIVEPNPGSPDRIHIGKDPILFNNFNQVGHLINMDAKKLLDEVKDKVRKALIA